jgi:hypothetical protein
MTNALDNTERIIVGGHYDWPLRAHPITRKRFRFLQWIIVEAIGKTGKRVRVRFDYEGKTYERTVSAAFLLAPAKRTPTP